VTSRAEPTAGTSVHPLADGRFRWFFAGRAASLLGSSMVWVALSFAILEASGRAQDLAVVMACYTVPLALLQMVGGAAADRYPRRTVLVVSSLGGALTQGAMAALLLTGSYALLPVAALGVLNGTLQAFSGPALIGIVPELVERPAVQRANALLAATRNGTKLGGPAVSGLLVAGAGGGWAIAVDALAYLVAAVCLLRVQVRGRARAAGGSVLRDVREGWSEFVSRSWVWTGSLALAGVNFLQAGAWGLLGPILAEDTIGAQGWGLVLSAGAAGTLLTSALMYRLTFGRLLFAGHAFLVIGALPLVLLGLGVPTPVLAAGSFLSGAAQGVYGVAYETSIHEHIPPVSMSRVSSIDAMGAYVTLPLGQLAVVPATAAFGDAQVAVVAGVLYAVVTAAALLVPGIRHLPHARS